MFHFYTYRLATISNLMIYTYMYIWIIILVFFKINIVSISHNNTLIYYNYIQICFNTEKGLIYSI
jgi:hypothetical protein